MSYDQEIREPLDRADWEQREVYANFGLAIYFCQVLEFQLVSYVALIRRSKAGRQMSEAKSSRLLDRLLGGTFGQNIGEVRDLLGGRSIIESPMAEALKLRNNLVHNWMRERALQQSTSENRLAMIQELKEARRTLQDADRVLTDARSRCSRRQASAARLSRNSTTDLPSVRNRGSSRTIPSTKACRNLMTSSPWLRSPRS